MLKAQMRSKCVCPAKPAAEFAKRLDCGAFTAAFSFSRRKNIQHSTFNAEHRMESPLPTPLEEPATAASLAVSDCHIGIAGRPDCITEASPPLKCPQIFDSRAFSRLASVLQGMARAMDNFRNKNILIVDDDESMSHALAKVLSGAGALVTSTHEASDAIEILIRRERDVHLVITDLRMPVVTGMTLVYAMHLIFPGIPVIVLTGFGNPYLRAECLRQGAAGFLEKNLSASELLDAVAHVLAAHQAGVERLADTARTHASAHCPAG